MGDFKVSRKTRQESAGSPILQIFQHLLQQVSMNSRSCSVQLSLSKGWQLVKTCSWAWCWLPQWHAAGMVSSPMINSPAATSGNPPVAESRCYSLLSRDGNHSSLVQKGISWDAVSSHQTAGAHDQPKKTSGNARGCELENGWKWLSYLNDFAYSELRRSIAMLNYDGTLQL